MSTSRRDRSRSLAAATLLLAAGLLAPSEARAHHLSLEATPPCTLAPQAPPAGGASALLEAYDLARRFGRGPLCAEPDDPRCAPAAPGPATLALADRSVAATVQIPTRPPEPPAGPETGSPPPLDEGLGPAAGARRAVERPPRS